MTNPIRYLAPPEKLHVNPRLSATSIRLTFKKDGYTKCIEDGIAMIVYVADKSPIDIQLCEKLTQNCLLLTDQQVSVFGQRADLKKRKTFVPEKITHVLSNKLTLNRSKGGWCLSCS